MHFYKRLTRRLNRQKAIDRLQLQPWTDDAGARLKRVMLNRKPENWSLDFVLVAKVLFWSPCWENLHEMHMKPCRIVLLSESNFVLAGCVLHRYRGAEGRGGGVMEAEGGIHLMSHTNATICQNPKSTRPAAVLSQAKPWMLVEGWTTPSSGG